VESLQEGFAEFRREVNAQMDSGVGKFQEHRALLDDHNVRIGRLENIHAAELAAHAEKTRRETGRVGK
jgi:hypothetical protein